MQLKTSKKIINWSLFLSIPVVAFLLFFYATPSGGVLVIRALLFVALLIYQIRYFYLINVLKPQQVTFQLIEKQRHPIALDTIVGVFLFAMLPVLLALLNIGFNNNLNAFDGVAFVLYLAGTSITSIAENQRRKWKLAAPNSLYKNGLFSYANHINYFGETIAFPALCWLATGSFWVFAIFLLHQLVDFIYVQIPRQEGYLQSKYPAEYDQIRHRKKLIPYVY